MSVLVLGATGLLGSTLCALYPEVTGITHEEVDLADEYSVEKMFSNYKPDVIINCAGIVPRRDASLFNIYNVNAFALDNLAYMCHINRSKLIHISTDCVFNPLQGVCHENTKPIPHDNYGISKLMGEYLLQHHYNILIIRTSFIGLPDNNGYGLLSWLHRQSPDQPVPGYTNVKWNGLTTTELARWIMWHGLEYDDSEILHVYGPTVTKYDVLEAVNEIENLGLTIYNDPAPMGTRLLDSLYNNFYDFKQPSRVLRDMLERMYSYRENIESYLRSL